MAIPYVTGPVHIFVGDGAGVGPNVSIDYLGTGLKAPRIRRNPAYEPVMNDLGGTMKPFDRLYEGYDAVVSVDLTRWNETVYKKISAASIPRRIPGPGGFGRNIQGDIGTLMVTEGRALQLWLLFPYARLKPVMSQNLMKDGSHFLATMMENPDEHDPGTGANVRRIVWYCGRIFNPVTQNFDCEDEDMSAVLNLQRN